MVSNCVDWFAQFVLPLKIVKIICHKIINYAMQIDRYFKNCPKNAVLIVTFSNFVTVLTYPTHFVSIYKVPLIDS